MDLQGTLFRGVGRDGSGTGVGALGAGLYLTWVRGYAEAYAEMKIGSVLEYRLRNPDDLKLLSTDDREWGLIKSKLGLEPWEFADSPLYVRAVTIEAKELGFDGVIDPRPEVGLVLFDPEAAERIP